jgi:integrase
MQQLDASVALSGRRGCSAAATMASRKQLPLPGDHAASPNADDVRAQRPQRLVLRSGQAASSVTFTRRRPERLAPGSDGQARGRCSGGEKRWQPPEGLTPAAVTAVIAAAQTECDRLPLRMLWATGGRVSEVLALRAQDARRDALVLPNLKNPSRRVKSVFLSAGDQDLPGALPLFQKAEGLRDEDPLFASRKGGHGGSVRAIGRVQAWRIVKDASERAHVQVLSLRGSKDGPAGASVPVHSHLFRHARVRQIVRPTKSLPLAQKQAGRSRLQLAHLTLGVDAALAEPVTGRRAGAGGAPVPATPARDAARDDDTDRAVHRGGLGPLGPDRPGRRGRPRGGGRLRRLPVRAHRGRRRPDGAGPRRAADGAHRAGHGRRADLPPTPGGAPSRP